MSTDKSEPAFPIADCSQMQFHGISKREYFAAMAMQAYITTAAAPCLNGLDGYEPQTAKAAYLMADHMIAEGA